MATFLRYLKCIRNFGIVSGPLSINQQRSLASSALRLNDSVATDFQRHRTREQTDFMIARNKKNLLKDKLGRIHSQSKTCNWVWKSNIETIIQSIRHPDSLNSYDTRLLISYCGSALTECAPSQRTKIVMQLWDKYKQHFISVNTQHYNALLQVHLENNYQFSPTDVLKEMKDNSIEPDIETYEKLIQLYCKQGNISDVLKIIEFMKEKGMSLTVPIFNSLITGHSENGDMDSAVNILNLMKENGIQIPNETYTTLMCAYAKRGDMENIQNIMSTCRNNKLYLTTKNILDVTYSLLVNDHTDHAQEMLKSISLNNNPDLTIMFITRLLEIRQEDLALDMLFDMCTALEKECAKKRQCLILFIKKLVFSDVEPEKIIEICSRFDDKTAILADHDVLLTAIQCSFERKDDLTFELLKRCKIKQYTFRPHYFWPLLVKFGGQKHDLHAIIEILKRMNTEFNVTPCIDTIVDYVVPYTFGDLQQLPELLKDCQIPSHIINNACVYTLLKKSKTRLASEYVSKYEDEYLYEKLGKILQKALLRTTDVASFLFLSSKLHGYPSNAELDADPSITFIDRQLAELMNSSNVYRLHVVEIIKYLKRYGYCVHAVTASKMRDYLANYATTQVLHTIKDITGVNNGRNIEPYYRNTSDRRLAKQHMPDRRTTDKESDNIRIVNSLLNNNEFDEAVEFIARHPLAVTNNLEFEARNLLYEVQSLPNYTAEHTERLFRALLKAQYIHLQFNSVKIVINAYHAEDKPKQLVKFLCSVTDEQYPLRRVMEKVMTVLIKKDEIDLLQTLVNHYTNILEKNRVYTCLYLGFLECERLKQAEKLLEFEWLKLDFRTMEARVSQWTSSGNKESMKLFLSAHLKLSGIERLKMYTHLVYYCDTCKDCESALNVWKKMQEDQIPLDDPLLLNLTNLLKKNNIDIPHSSDTETKDEGEEKIKQPLQS